MVRRFTPFARLRLNRSGVSILEVLFAILITAIGLMGAIAIFPAAMLQARRGMDTDQAAVAGLTAISRFNAEGMRQPNRWLLPSNNSPGNPWPTYPAPRVPPPDGQFAFCIDPLFVAANPGDPNANFFPYGRVQNFPFGGKESPIIRVTLNNGVPGSTTPMSRFQAELTFRVEDDIAYDRLKDGAASQFAGGYTNSSADTNAQRRQSQGHFSWMATLSPKLERLPTGSPLEDRYILSIVVFQDRPTELGSAYPASEWTVNVTPHGGWVNGGDVTLTAPTTLPNGIATSADAVDVRAGQWIMLVAQTDTGTNGRRMPLCRWYRVIDADGPDTSTTPATCAVTLAGADFTDFTNGPQPVAIICKGVVAVYEKTITLEPGL